MRLTAMLLAAAILLSAGCGKEPAQQDETQGTGHVQGGSGKKVTAAKPAGGSTADSYVRYRLSMVEQQLEYRGIRDRNVLEAMRIVPRHEFVPPDYREDSYADTPLPIGYGQTISQPYIVALMTEMLGIGRNSKVLEVGTGSGYQAAVLAGMGADVYSVEIVRELHDRSRADLDRAGYGKVKTLHADGYYGWKEHAPYDAIIVTCAAEFIPPDLIRQLKNGGVMCIPVGPPFKVQQLLLVRKSAEGKIKVNVITEVRFVPLVRSGD